ncbi:MAG TPA: hypothetical protein ENK21_08930 [Trueperaceae bacterium]|nr:hypothetical protein [Trueperaceae bacterium]
MNNLNTGRKLTFIVIANLLSASILNLVMNLISAQGAPLPSVLTMLVLCAGLSFGLLKGLSWTRIAAGVIAAIYASSSLFYGINLLASVSAMAIVYIFMGIIFLISALILFGAQSLRDFMAYQRTKPSA